MIACLRQRHKDASPEEKIMIVYFIKCKITIVDINAFLFYCTFNISELSEGVQTTCGSTRKMGDVIS